MIKSKSILEIMEKMTQQMFKTLHKGQETHLRRRLYDLRVILWEVRSIY